MCGTAIKIQDWSTCACCAGEVTQSIQCLSLQNAPECQVHRGAQLSATFGAIGVAAHRIQSLLCDTSSFPKSILFLQLPLQASPLPHRSAALAMILTCNVLHWERSVSLLVAEIGKVEVGESLRACTH